MPSSSTWAGAQGLHLRLEQTAVLLDSGVIANAGHGRIGAASHADGRIRLFGAGNCTALSMPDNHPAYALALSKNGNLLAAWAQGVNRLVFFDLQSAGCPASSVETTLSGRISLTLNASGEFLAAQDSAGNVWLGSAGNGRTGGDMRHVATLPGQPAAIGFSDAGGVLLAVDALGRGGSWNPRTGKLLHRLDIPGGPFQRGEFSGTEARLWTGEGRLVRWDVLHNRALDNDAGNPSAEAPRPQGWLELRGAELFHVLPGQSWRPEPAYEPRLPQLAHSEHAQCLRLADVDGLVRYFDAETGSERTQCFAEDWVPVGIRNDGTAQIRGLNLRVFDTISRSGPGLVSGSKVNCRAISARQLYLWTDRAPELTLRIQTRPAPLAGSLQNMPEPVTLLDTEGFTVSLRQGLAADGPARLLRIR
ncbi:MAG: WD40 repeat domain-containing protein [Proteobacteria bacterium]|nr:WD40 repeat domain-containing protein [Pseudomonadota bacterium]MBU1594943.1 WD40 repeat domain-containing protein [Pseudomonadota bacterium]